jgi:lipoate-protein ligase A
MSVTWLLLQSPAGNAVTNMAVDEALLHSAAGRRLPLLRVYAWVRPAVSFGYSQKFPAPLAAKYEIIRRPTGGGVVYHGADTTYTVVVPPGHPLYEMSITDAYCAIHEAVAAAIGSQSQIINHKSPIPRTSYECFQNPVRGDVVADGKKLAGGAQRRTKHGVLHQGSIAANVTVGQLQAGFRNTLQAEFRPYALCAAECAMVGKLVREKYATDSWNKRV